MSETAFRESTAPLLRPRQAEKMLEEQRRLEGMLQAPPHIAGQIDRGEVQRQYKRVARAVQEQTPKPYLPSEKDAAQARAKQLEGEISDGMLSHAEMRRNPPGAVDRHRKWERRNKKKIAELKSIKLRNHVTGDDPDRLEDEMDVANIEYLRPTESRMNLDVAQITPADYHLPAGPIASTNHMSDADREAGEAELLALTRRLAAQGNPVALRTLAVLEGKAPKPGKGGLRGRREMSPEERKAIGERFAAGRAKKAAERAAAEQQSVAEV